MATSEADIAAKLIERLLADPEFRARFRRDPAGACREAGLEQLAQEMSMGAGKAMHTLDIRESKSSLAGVMMAAAMEGVGIYQLTENVLPHLEELPGHVANVLSRIDLPAIGAHHKPGGGAAAVGGPADPSSAPATGGAGKGAADASSAPGNSGAASSAGGKSAAGETASSSADAKGVADP